MNRRILPTVFLLNLLLLTNLSWGQTCDGGTVSTASGNATAYTCPGDGNADAIDFAVSGNSADNFIYVVTDANGIILGLPPANTVDFEGAGTGTCLVWGLSYTGNLTAQMGDNALTTTLSDGCFDLSDNSVSIQRDNPDGGHVTTVDGATTAYTCPGDGNADEISFAVTGNSNSNFQWVVTDDQGTILGLPPGNTVNFEGAGVGNCLVWGLAYTGHLTAQMGDNALQIALSDDCFDLSDVPVSVQRDVPDGGVVTTVDGATTAYTCPGDGNADEISFAVTGNSNSNFQWVVTDDQGTILGLPPGNTVNFEGAGVGNCLVWGLAYTGHLTAQMGDNALTTALSDDCFDLSDVPVSVQRDVPDGGVVTTVDGATTAYTCPGDGNADEISFAVTGNSNSNFQWVVTDDQGTILGLPPGNTVNFEGAGVGNCLVWGLAYTGNLTAQMGDNALQIALSDDCFDLSDVPVSVQRDNPDGGHVATVDGDSRVYTCPGDGIADEISFAVSGQSNSNFQWVVTDDQGTILGLPPGNTVNFEGAGVGNCLVWGLSYTGNLTAQMGDNALQIALSDDCFDLSDNYVEVVRSSNCVNGFTLINARTDTDIQPINDGDVIVLNQLPTNRINIRADVFGSGIGSVIFKLNGHRVRTENFAPYALAGDRNGDYFHIPVVLPGTYTLMATPYSQRNGRGAMGSPYMVTFTIVRSMNRVTGFTLIDADTDQDIGPLNDGDVVDPAALGVRRLSVRANTNPGVVGSVVFGINGRHRTENFAPYALGGDRNGNYYPVNFRPGSVTISATPYGKRNAMGDVGPTETITFTYIRPSGYKEFSQEVSMNIYPNPGQGKINLEITEVEAGTVQIDVLSLQGARVHSESLESNGGPFLHKLNLEQLPAGTYLLNLKAGGQVFREKIIKQ
ncbi:MAG: T9SS type A sorting domain-containing protein [Bacteroidota bacterium]